MELALTIIFSVLTFGWILAFRHKNAWREVHAAAVYFGGGFGMFFAGAAAGTWLAVNDTTQADSYYLLAILGCACCLGINWAATAIEWFRRAEEREDE